MNTIPIVDNQLHDLDERIEVMLKRSRKQLLQRLNPPIKKHSWQPLAWCSPKEEQTK
jgi:hypothetical protein